ncbi:alpha/beta hydrolase domain-containing protein [Collybia nuda]|uniref:Alpha/beta hydrolase domain-containing protein n=1 Tax=Collybia nuda TaxID=64659 RepID=A0A9P5YEB1_9AGAR|nr:alpha/beta hydrolase domain-containing protein [Collybia nuda]
MEALSKLQESDIPAIIMPTASAFLPLLEKNRSQIEAVPRSTFKYGPTDRHQLDVYYPVSHDGSGKTPVLVWIYGGGFTSGDRRLEAPMDLGYACVGAYFARKGFVVVIPDYRLAPDFTFPSGAQDVRDATVWVIQHPEHLTTPTSPNPDVGGVFMMGHSAGAVHVFAALMLPQTPETAVLKSNVVGAILCAGAFNIRELSKDAVLYPVIVQHYNGEERVQEDEPMGLLRRADDATVAALPRLIVVEGEKEPSWLLTAGADFRDAIEARIGKRPEWIVAKHHNHISTNMALSTGEGEEWAESVIEWIKRGDR